MPTVNQLTHNLLTSHKPSSPQPPADTVDDLRRQLQSAQELSDFWRNQYFFLRDQSNQYHYRIGLALALKNPGAKSPDDLVQLTAAMQRKLASALLAIRQVIHLRDGITHFCPWCKQYVGHTFNCPGANILGEE